MASPSPICSYQIFSPVATITIGTTLYLNNCLTEIAYDGYYSDGTNCYQVNASGVVTSITSCGSTTTTTLIYDYYLANKYSCPSCVLDTSNVLVAFPTGTNVQVGYYYIALQPDGFVYEILSSTTSGAALLMSTFGFSSCNVACNVV